jgi:DNA-binding NarL/FixJ family response regulator
MPPLLVCLVLTMYKEDDLIFDALHTGACGYLRKLHIHSRAEIMHKFGK